MATQAQVVSNTSGQSWIKWVVLTLGVAVLAFLASPMGPLGGFWRPSSDIHQPAGIQLGLFLLLNIFEVVTFGIGVSFLVFGYPIVQRVLPRSKGLGLTAYLAIAWLMMNWWPHNSLHMANGANLTGLLVIDYAFHLTLMASGVIMAIFFFKVAQQQNFLSK